MSIVITNMGPNEVNVSSDPLGEHDYVIKINNHVLGFFKHTRKDGLGVCLEKASERIKQLRKENENA